MNGHRKSGTGRRYSARAGGSVDPVLAEWAIAVEREMQAVVIPDGCRDVILWRAPGMRPRVLFTPLDAKARTVRLAAGSHLQGLRLRPGASMDERGLMGALPTTRAEMRDCVADFAFLCPAVDEALAGLAGEVETVAEVAAMAGVAPRTLHRLVSRHTGHGPRFWLRLGRVRRAAAMVAENVAAVETAAACGYADQAHMSHEFRRWLGVTPAALRSDGERVRLVRQPGYGWSGGNG